MPKYHLAQINIARMQAPLTSLIMAGFVEQLPIINALADESPGFVWRLQSEGGNATDLRAYGDEYILVNMSVWEEVESLRLYVYRSAHTAVMRNRKQWFTEFDGPYYALWWILEGHVPSIDEGKERLEHLRRHGPTAYAFSFQKLFPNPSDGEMVLY